MEGLNTRVAEDALLADTALVVRKLDARLRVASPSRAATSYLKDRVRMEKKIDAMRHGAAGRGSMPVCVLALLGSLWMHPASSALKYDPQSCKVDTEGRIFVQISRQLLAIPVGEFGLAEPLYAGSTRTFEPTLDPAQPKGCPDNPIQTTRYVPHLHLARPASGSAATSDRQLDSLELIYVVPGPIEGLPGVTWGGEATNLHSLERRCKNPAIRERLPSGIVACRVKPRDPNVRVEDWGASYSIPITDYATPLGTTFVASCLPAVYSTRITDCDVAYSMRLDLGLTYRFHPFGPGPHLAIDDVIELDKEVRAAINRYISDGQRLSCK